MFFQNVTPSIGKSATLFLGIGVGVCRWQTLASPTHINITDVFVFGVAFRRLYSSCRGVYPVANPRLANLAENPHLPLPKLLSNLPHVTPDTDDCDDISDISDISDIKSSCVAPPTTT